MTDGGSTTAWQLGSAVDGSATNVSEWCGILTSCRKTRFRSRGVDMMTRLTSFKSAPAGKVPCPFNLVLGMTVSTVIFAVICCSASKRARQHGGSRRSRMSANLQRSNLALRHAHAPQAAGLAAIRQLSPHRQSQPHAYFSKGRSPSSQQAHRRRLIPNGCGPLHFRIRDRYTFDWGAVTLLNPQR